MLMSLGNHSNLKVDLVYDDLPMEILNAIKSRKVVALDIETSGLDYHKDKIGSVQVYCEQHPVVFIRVGDKHPVNLIKIMEDPKIKKIFHYAIFDLSFMYAKWNIRGRNIACTKIASRLLDPKNSHSHSLQSLLRRYLGVNLSKELQTSDWLSPDLSESQIEYAANDVLYLQTLLDKICKELKDEDLWEIALACFSHIPTRVFLNVNNYPDIFLHK